MPEPYGTVNYAVEYSRELANAYPYALHFGALYATPNNGRYRVVNAKTIEIPTISTNGRVNADRDTITTAQRNYSNDWEPKVLSNQRKWSTLVHPMDVQQTNMVATIGNITRTMNETQKFPEMDSYCVSKIYGDWTKGTSDGGAGQTPLKDGSAEGDINISTTTVLDIFDTMMLNMDNANVPMTGRILYCTHEVKKMLKNADKIERSLNVETAVDVINRTVNRLDEVTIVGVPAKIMKTKFNFTIGAVATEDADQINMMLIHPDAVITPVSYAFSQLDQPSAGSEGKYIYFEESYEDVFILNKKAGAIQFHITPHA